MGALLCPRATNPLNPHHKTPRSRGVFLCVNGWAYAVGEGAVCAVVTRGHNGVPTLRSWSSPTIVGISRYRRASVAGATYFFTVVAYRRQAILCDAAIRHALRAAIESVRVNYPFEIDAWVLLPDHLHCMWTLPAGDVDFSTRWSLIKRQVSLAYRENYWRADWLNASKQKHRESTRWQRRFWEHQIRDDNDFARHVDYIHHNPVRHGHVKIVADWPYSTFHRYVREGSIAGDRAGAAYLRVSE